MLIANYSYINQICGHNHSGITNPCQFLRPHVMRGYYTYSDSGPNGEQIKRDGFPTGTNPPYSLVMGDKGALLSATTTVSGSSSTAISMAMGLAAESALTGSGTIAGSLSLVIQLACSILASGNISASLVGKLEMASALAGSGNLTASLNLIAFVISAITGSGTISGTFKGNASLAADISSSSTLSPENLAAAVWNSIAASFNTAGTMGNKMNSAASAGDPWSTALPGAYADGEAGKILAQIQTLVDELHQLEGLKDGSPMTVTPSNRSVGTINLDITGDGENQTIVTRND
jgi:hypothetical protein